MLDQNLIVGLVVLAVVVLAVYAYAPRLKGMLSGMGFEGFQNEDPKKYMKKKEGFANHLILTQPAGVNGGTGATDAASQEERDRKNQHAVPNPPAPTKEAFGDYANFNDTMGAVPMAAAKKPQGCYPREQLNPMELLPSDPNSQWAQVNPTGAGDIQGKNFLSAGALIGINTIGQSMRNSNLQLRAEPPNPQVQVSPWLQSTIEPDLSRRPLE
jgi:hypothetical protein